MTNLYGPTGFIMAALLALASPVHAQDEALTRAQALLSRTPVIDGHNDVPIKIRTQLDGHVEGFAFARLPDAQRNLWQSDIARMRAGGIGGQFWSVYVPPELTSDAAVRMTLEQIDIAHRLIERFPDSLRLATTAAEVEDAMRHRRIASLLGAEGGNSIGNSLGVLRQLYALGVRYITLTHRKTIDWADSATDAPRHGGLTPFGVEVVREMNRLGMLVDLSHVSPETMLDALAATQAPVIFSHSNARAVYDHVRSVPDEVLQKLPANGGIVMVTFIPATLDAGYDSWKKTRDAREAELLLSHPQDPDAVKRALSEWELTHPKPESTVAQVADHVDYLRKTVGIDHIGIGSDWEGVTDLPAGLKSADQLPNLFAELIRRGYSNSELSKIAQGNILRVMRQAERVAKRLQ